MEIDKYLISLDKTDINIINIDLEENDGDIEFVLKKNLTYLDCSRTFPNGMRIIQTIDYIYKHYISVCKYLIDILDEPLKSEYMQQLEDIHAKNLDYEESVKPVVYTKTKKASKKPKVAKEKKERGPTVAQINAAAKAAKLGLLKFKTASNDTV